MLSVLRFRDFRLLWISQSASVIGDSLVVVAIGIYVTRWTGQATDVGLVLAAYSLPFVLFLLVGGVLADRLPRQRVMVVSDTIRCALHGTLAILIVTGAVQIWQMVLIGVGFGTAQAFFQPAYSGLVPQTVDESDIQSAQALNGVSRELAEFLSPVLATVLVLGVGGAAAFGLDSLTFAFSALLLTRVRGRQRGEPGTRGTVLTELRDGWRAVRDRSWVWGTILAFSATLVVALAPFFVLGASVARDVYGGEAAFGLISAAWGVGTISGALLGSRWRPHRPMRAAMLAALPWPAAVTLYAAGPPQPLMYVAMAVAGCGLGLFGVWWETALAQRVPAHLLSRVSAWDWMGSLALLPAGYLLAGPLAEAIGEVRVLEIGGVVGVIAMALGLLPHSTRTMRRLEEGPAPVAGPPPFVVASR